MKNDTITDIVLVTHQNLSGEVTREVKITTSSGSQHYIEAGDIVVIEDMSNETYNIHSHNGDFRAIRAELMRPVWELLKEKS